MKRHTGDYSAEESRSLLLRRKLAEVEQVLKEGEEEEDEAAEDGQPSVTGTSERAVVRLLRGAGEVVVVIGTSEHAQIPGMMERICCIVDAAYSGAGKHKRLDEYDARHRLAMGDAGPGANRVLHLAFLGSELVGCASSTFSPGWTPEGCGHWGLLAVDPAHQGRGVATALVHAAERRLATACGEIQIEYQYTPGDEHSKKLLSWYEGKLGFDGGPPPSRRGSSFRRCFKDIPEEQQRRGRRRRLLEIHAWLHDQLKQETQEEQMHAAVVDHAEQHCAAIVSP